jgi:hypothetical protein
MWINFQREITALEKNNIMGNKLMQEVFLGEHQKCLVKGRRIKENYLLLRNQRINFAVSSQEKKEAEPRRSVAGSEMDQ